MHENIRPTIYFWKTWRLLIYDVQDLAKQPTWHFQRKSSHVSFICSSIIHFLTVIHVGKNFASLFCISTIQLNLWEPKRADKRDMLLVSLSLKAPILVIDFTPEGTAIPDIDFFPFFFHHWPYFTAFSTTRRHSPPSLALVLHSLPSPAKSLLTQSSHLSLPLPLQPSTLSISTLSMTVHLLKSQQKASTHLNNIHRNKF